MQRVNPAPTHRTLLAAEEAVAEVRVEPRFAPSRAEKAEHRRGVQRAERLRKVLRRATLDHAYSCGARYVQHAKREPVVVLRHMWRVHLREMRDALAALLGPRAQVGAEEVAPAVQPRAGVACLPTGATLSATLP